MGQPTPPGDIPLIQGLGAEWNDIVSLIPEDKRGEIAPKFQERLSTLTEPYKDWENFRKSGVSPEQVDTALNIYSIIENKPKEVYDLIGKHLGITSQEVKEVVEATDEELEDDPRLAALQQQVETLTQITLAQRQAEITAQQTAEQDQALDNEIKDLRKRYGNDFPEDEILMRMAHKGLSAEDAYKEYAERVDGIMKRRPAPFVLGGGGNVPREPIDVTKLDGVKTRNVVAQMLQHANDANRS